MAPLESTVRDLIGSITGLHPLVERLAHQFREFGGAKEGEVFDIHSADNWRRNTYGNALVRLRIILENNFRVVESLGLLAVTRYVFELSLWLKLFQQNVNYALLYRKELIVTQLNFYKDLLKQHEHEVELLKQLGQLDSARASDAFKRLSDVSDLSFEEAAAMFCEARNEIDSIAARKFSLFADQAKSNGYAFQAFLVETQAIPAAHQHIKELEAELSDFEQISAKLTRGLNPCPNWKSKAKEVGLVSEYDFIYAFASKLLHCTPASLTTNQKNLEETEVVVFLRYIRTKFRDIIDLALQQPECRLRTLG
jgi:hypothetical protein